MQSLWDLCEVASNVDKPKGLLNQNMNLERRRTVLREISKTVLKQEVGYLSLFKNSNRMKAVYL